LIGAPEAWVEPLHPKSVPDLSPDEEQLDGREARRSRISLAIAYLKTHRRPASAVLLAAAVVGTSVALLLPSIYTARASFYSEGKQSGDMSSLSSSLGGLGALLTAAGGTIGGNQSTFFVDLLKSQAFFDSVAASPIQVTPNGPQVLVRDYVAKRAKTEADRRWKARIALRKMIDVSSQPSGVVVVRVDAKSPVAAAAIANRSVDVIDNLNVRFRRDQAASRRKFTEGFLAGVEARLNASEARLEDFLMSNRSLLSMRSSVQSPVLQRQQEQLRGETMRLTALKEQLESTIENARLTEFNDAPVVARVDRAPAPERRSGPPRTLIALGSILLAATLIFWVAYIRGARLERV
jgi:uncharacterized protein involved in exopolysaccharide biosynthesis